MRLSVDNAEALVVVVVVAETEAAAAAAVVSILFVQSTPAGSFQTVNGDPYTSMSSSTPSLLTECMRTYIVYCVPVVSVYEKL